MCEVIVWLNLNEGTVNAILSVLSLAIACIAVVVSISTAKRQSKIDLFEKRYEIYSRFSELIHLAEILSHDTLAYKGKMMFFNCNFFGHNTESSQIGSEILKLDESLLMTNPESEEYKVIATTKEEKARKKFILDYSILAKDEILLEKSSLLFPKYFVDHIKGFFKTYSDIVMSANFTDEKTMDSLFTKWRKICVKLHNEKYLEKMRKHANLNK